MREGGRPYEPNIESLNQHVTPDWYADAKLGIFIHYGLYSVPGYAGRHDFSRYFGDVSLKGAAGLDWDSESERVAFLTELVVDVR